MQLAKPSSAISSQSPRRPGSQYIQATASPTTNAISAQRNQPTNHGPCGPALSVAHPTATPRTSEASNQPQRTEIS